MEFGGSNTRSIEMAPSSQYDWTVLIYSMANQRGLRSVANNILQHLDSMDLPATIKVAMQVTLSNRTTHPLRLYDFETRSGARRYKDVQTGLEYTPQRDVNPVHNLSHFIRSCRRRFPAKRCAVILQGHSCGIDYDLPTLNLADTTGPRASSPFRALLGSPLSHSRLSNKQLQVALSDALAGEKLAFFGLDTCLMGMAEIMYQLRHCADYVVASEGLSAIRGWPLERILPHLGTRSGLTFGQLILDRSVTAFKDFERRAKIPMGLYSLRWANELARTMKGLTNALTRGLSHPALFRAIVHGRLKCIHFAMPSYVDLRDLCNRLKQELQRLPAAELQSAEAVTTLKACAAVGAALDKRFTVASVLQRKHRSAHGLSIYFPAWQIGIRSAVNHGPGSPASENPSLAPASLSTARRRITTAYLAHDFVTDTGWDKFLVAFVTARRVHHSPLSGHARKTSTTTQTPRRK
jgi:hypothetical protein